MSGGWGKSRGGRLEAIGVDSSLAGALKKGHLESERFTLNCPF